MYVTVKYVSGPVRIVRLKGPRPLLEPRTCDWLCAVCANGVLLGRAHARAWVQLDQMKRTAPNSAPAVPRTAAEATYARSTRVRRRTCELGVDPCSAALVEAVDVRQHLRLFATPASSGLRATARYTGTRSMHYFKAGCSGVAERAHRQPCAPAG